MQQLGPADRRLPEWAMDCKNPLCIPWRRWLWVAALVAAAAVHGADNPQRQPAVGSATMQLLRPVLLAASRSDETSQLQLINRFFNQHIEFATDQEAWGQGDYWASPLEALRHGRGDCEDYAFAKYFSLLAAGMPTARLRLVYVRAVLDDGAPQAHMVVAHYPAQGGEPLILDNLVDDILPASRRSDLSPVFSFNSQGLWQGVGPVSAGNPALRLTRWRDVMARARAEGFP